MEQSREKAKVPEVPVPEQLTKDELECIGRHIKELVERNFKENPAAQSACQGCGIKCSKTEGALDPWPAFIKLSDITGVAISIYQGNQKLSKSINIEFAACDNFTKAVEEVIAALEIVVPEQHAIEEISNKIITRLGESLRELRL